MKLSDISNLLPGETVKTENPLRKIITQQRDKDLKTALRVALKDKKTGNPTDNTNPNVRTGGEDSNDSNTGTVTV